MLCRYQCVFLKNMSDEKSRDVGWVGGVGKDDTANNLGRGGVDFLQLVNFIDGYPYLEQLFGLDEIGSDVDACCVTAWSGKGYQEHICGIWTIEDYPWLWY